MNKKILSLILTIGCITVIATAFIPTMVAQGQTIIPPATGDTTPSLPNPLGKDVDIMKVMLRIMQVALAAVDIFALFMFILGGFQFLISAGNPNMIKRAKDTLIWATIGILVITLSYSILKFIFEGITKNIGG